MFAQTHNMKTNKDRKDNEAYNSNGVIIRGRSNKWISAAHSHVRDVSLQNLEMKLVNNSSNNYICLQQLQINTSEKYQI